MQAEYLTTVGKLTQHAGFTDLLLYSAFEAIVGCGAPIAHAIFYSLESVHAKGQMIRRVLEVAGDKEDSRIIDDLIEATKKAHQVRNELAHALLTMDMDEKELSRFNPRAQKQPKRPVTPEYLRSLMERSAEGRVAAMAAYTRLCAKRGMPAPVMVEPRT